MLRIGGGKMSITDGSRSVFDTDDKLLHILGAVNGVTPFMSYQAGNNVGYELNDKIVLGNVPAQCTQVIGAAKFTLGSGSMGFNRWTMVMGGSLIWLMDGEPGFQTNLGNNSGCHQFVMYHFSVSAGVVYLNRRVILSGVPAQYVVKGHAITYRLQAGIWV